MATSSKKERGSQKDENAALPEIVSLDEETQKTFEKKIKQFKSNRPDVMTPGVVYLGNIPHGFFEPQMRDFFAQFGKILKIRLSRSKKTGGSKGYAFIKFQCDEVAKIVAETMNNYLMFEKLLKCQFMPEESQHPELFKGANRKFKWPKSHLVARERHNMQKQSATTKRFLKKNKKKAAALEKLGVKLKGSTMEQAVKEAEKIRQGNKEAQKIRQANREAEKLRQANTDSAKTDEKKENESNSTMGEDSSQKQEEKDQTPVQVSTPRPKRKQPVDVLKTPVITEQSNKRKQPGSAQKTPDSTTSSEEQVSKRKQPGSVQKTPRSTTSSEEQVSKRKQPGTVQKTPGTATSPVEQVSKRKKSVDVMTTPITRDSTSKRKKSADVVTTPITTVSTSKRKKSISNVTANDDSSSLVTPRNKRIKSVDVKTEPPKRRKSLVPEKTVGSARTLKTPKSLSKPTTRPNTRSKRLSV